jgi:hypothetical protein
LALGAPVQAAPPPSYVRDIPIPPGTQIGTGSLAVKCSLKERGVPVSSGTVQVWVSGALPTIARPGQSLWVTSIHGRLELPVQTTDQLYAIGVRKLKVKLTSSKLLLRDGATQAPTWSTATTSRSRRLRSCRASRSWSRWDSRTA